MKTPYTAISVATAWVPNTAINKIFAGRMDQKGPRVRVRNMVRCPATDIFKYIMVWVCAWSRWKTFSESQNRPKMATVPMTPRTVEMPSTSRMFHASGLLLYLTLS